MSEKFDVDQFDPSPDPDLVCCICQGVLNDPVESPCRHVFCRGCIERWLRNTLNCPTCRDRLYKEELRPVLPILLNVINRLTLKCKFRESGCEEKIPLERYDNHIKTCDFEILTCRFTKCGKQMHRKELKSHENDTCIYREVKCTRACELMISITEIDSHNCLQTLKQRLADNQEEKSKLLVEMIKLKDSQEDIHKQMDNIRQQINRRNRRRSFYLDFPSSPDISDTSDTYTDYTDFTQDDIVSPPLSPRNASGSRSETARNTEPAPGNSSNLANNNDRVTVDVDSEISFNLRGRNHRLPSSTSASDNRSRSPSPLPRIGSISDDQAREGRHTSTYTSQRNNRTRRVTEETVVRRYESGDPAIQRFNLLSPSSSTRREIVGPVVHTRTTRTYHYIDPANNALGEANNNNDVLVTAFGQGENEATDESRPNNSFSTSFGTSGILSPDQNMTRVSSTPGTGGHHSSPMSTSTSANQDTSMDINIVSTPNSSSPGSSLSRNHSREHLTRNNERFPRSHSRSFSRSNSPFSSRSRSRSLSRSQSRCISRSRSRSLARNHGKSSSRSHSSFSRSRSRSITRRLWRSFSRSRSRSFSRSQSRCISRSRSRSLARNHGRSSSRSHSSFSRSRSRSITRRLWRSFSRSRSRSFSRSRSKSASRSHSHGTTAPNPVRSHSRRRSFSRSPARSSATSVSSRCSRNFSRNLSKSPTTHTARIEAGKSRTRSRSHSSADETHSKTVYYSLSASRSRSRSSDRSVFSSREDEKYPHKEKTEDIHRHRSRQGRRRSKFSWSSSTSGTSCSSLESDDADPGGDYKHSVANSPRNLSNPNFQDRNSNSGSVSSKLRLPGRSSLLERISRSRSHSRASERSFESTLNCATPVQHRSPSVNRSPICSVSDSSKPRGNGCLSGNKSPLMKGKNSWQSSSSSDTNKDPDSSDSESELTDERPATDRNCLSCERNPKLVRHCFEHSSSPTTVDTSRSSSPTLTNSCNERSPPMSSGLSSLPSETTSATTSVSSVTPVAAIENKPLGSLAHVSCDESLSSEAGSPSHNFTLLPQAICSLRKKISNTDSTTDQSTNHQAPANNRRQRDRGPTTSHKNVFTKDLSKSDSRGQKTSHHRGNTSDSARWKHGSTVKTAFSAAETGVPNQELATSSIPCSMNRQGSDNTSMSCKKSYIVNCSAQRNEMNVPEISSSIISLNHVPSTISQPVERVSQGTEQNKKRPYSIDEKQNEEPAKRKKASTAGVGKQQNASRPSVIWDNSCPSQSSNQTVNVKIDLSLNVEPLSTTRSAKSESLKGSSKPSTFHSSTSTVSSCAYNQPKHKTQSVSQPSKPSCADQRKPAESASVLQATQSKQGDKSCVKGTGTTVKMPYQTKRPTLTTEQPYQAEEMRSGNNPRRYGSPKQGQDNNRRLVRRLILQPVALVEDSDDSSDTSWSPGDHLDDSEDTISEEIDSDSSYELLVPKTTQQLLDELADIDDNSDDTWSP